MASRGEPNTTALKAIPGSVQSASIPSGVPIAVVPRGFGFRWGRRSDTLRELADHHVLQMAYNLDYAEKFAEFGKDYLPGGEPTTPSLPLPGASYVEAGISSWETKTIFKDNKLRRSYLAEEVVTPIGGHDVGVVQPPVTILPREDGGGLCPSGDSTVHTRDVTTREVPYEYALPMLTGWDLAYVCDDGHVTEAGVWIERFTYARHSASGGGTLSHTESSILRDKKSKRLHVSRQRITILGLRRLEPRVPTR
jgi:hypothetical protein